MIDVNATHIFCGIRVAIRLVVIYSLHISRVIYEVSVFVGQAVGR